jgi:hypothetical protein
MGGQETRGGCEFSSFFSCVDGATPSDLLKRGIYSEIAVALKGGPWREVSMSMLGMAFGLSKEQEEAQALGMHVLDMSFSEGSIQQSLQMMTSGLMRMRRKSENVLDQISETSQGFIGGLSSSVMRGSQASLRFIQAPGAAPARGKADAAAVQAASSTNSVVEMDGDAP